MPEKLPYIAAFPHSPERSATGISILDYFAAHALSGLISLGKELEDETITEDGTQAQVVASQA